MYFPLSMAEWRFRMDVFMNMSRDYVDLRCSASWMYFFFSSGLLIKKKKENKKKKKNPSQMKTVRQPHVWAQ